MTLKLDLGLFSGMLLVGAIILILGDKLNISYLIYVGLLVIAVVLLLFVYYVVATVRSSMSSRSLKKQRMQR